MREHIKMPKVEDVAIAVVEELNDEKTETVYNVYLINLKDVTLENVLVSSKGYGENKSTGEQIKTSILRHGLGNVTAQNYTKIEPIIKEVFGLTNEYWLSFFIGKQMFDKKFIFLPETIQESNYVNVPILNKKGVLIR